MRARTNVGPKIRGAIPSQRSNESLPGTGRAFDGKFGCTVERGHLSSNKSAERRKVENPTFTRGTHYRQHCPSDVEDPKYICGKLLLSVLDGCFFKESVKAVTGVVHKHVDAANS